MSRKHNDINDLASLEHTREVLRKLYGPKPRSQTHEPSNNPSGGTGAPLDDGLADESAVVAAMIVAPREGLPAEPQSFMALPVARADVLDAYLDSCASGASRRAMAQSLDRAARLLGAPDARAVPWASLRFEHTDRIRAGLMRAVQEKRYRMATAKLTLVAVRRVLHQAARSKLISRDDYADAIDLTPLPKHKRLPTGRLLPEAEIIVLWAYCERTGGAYGAFLKATLALLLGTGLRAHEASKMPIDAYDPTAREVRLIRKGGKEDSEPIGDVEGEALDAWLPIRRGFQKRLSTSALLVRVQKNDWVRPETAELNAKTLEYVLKIAAADAGVPCIRPHDLRRTFCSRALDEGDLSAVQQLMGHEDPKTTALYDLRGARAKKELRARLNIIPRPKTEGEPK